MQPASATDLDDIFESKPPGSGAPAVVRATDLTGVHVLKHDNLFMLADSHGDIQLDGRGLGLYAGDTRVLSTYDLRLNGIRPVVLRAGPAASYRGTIQLTNPDFFDPPSGSADENESEVILRRHSLGVVRERAIGDGFGERISVQNYTTLPERARLTFRLDADYADIFELRGFIRAQRGERLPTRGDGGLIEFGYRGLDGATRRTFVRFSPALTLVDSDGRAPATGPVTLELDTTLPPTESVTVTVDIWAEVPPPVAKSTDVVSVDADEAAGSDDTDEIADISVRSSVSADEAEAVHRSWRSSSASIETTDVLAQRALGRASADLRLLLNSGPGQGERYVGAGVPWFSCLFGRDSLINSIQLLSVRPQVARSTLSILARLQATELDEWHDAQPGKILHELREGELARANEIPHTPYYGTVDATPLWLMLLDEYERWTGDAELIERLWPNAMAALGWMDKYGDLDGDGLIEYDRQSRHGLVNQGWKDSGDAIRNRDGTLVEGPIALVEVQGYAFAARKGLARLARLRGDETLAVAQEDAAERLRVRFEETFWLEEQGIYSMALDGNKRPVDSVASNAGHALWTGICSQERADSTARVLTGPGMWSGWGIRTLSSDTVGYNPIGYHLGTIWPHDNGICAAGFARYGLIDEARLVAGTLFEATMHFREGRLPELFCGFERNLSPLPVPYPVACSPQAWAAGSLFHLVSATLGMQPNAREHRLELYRPSLPASLPELRMRNLRVGDSLVDLEFAGQEGSISVEVLHRTGDLDVVVRL